MKKMIYIMLYITITQGQPESQKKNANCDEKFLLYQMQSYKSLCREKYLGIKDKRVSKWIRLCIKPFIKKFVVCISVVQYLISVSNIRHLAVINNASSIGQKLVRAL
jgi:hypothetical protein